LETIGHGSQDCDGCMVQKCSRCMSGGCVISEEACEVCIEKGRDSIEYEDIIHEIEECQKEKLDISKTNTAYQEMKMDHSPGLDKF